MNTGQARVALGIRFSWIGDVADRLGGVVPKGLKLVADLYRIQSYVLVDAVESFQGRV